MDHSVLTGRALPASWTSLIGPRYPKTVLSWAKTGASWPAGCTRAKTRQVAPMKSRPLCPSGSTKRLKGWGTAGCSMSLRHGERLPESRSAFAASPLPRRIAEWRDRAQYYESQNTTDGLAFTQRDD